MKTNDYIRELFPNNEFKVYKQCICDPADITTDEADLANKIGQKYNLLSDDIAKMILYVKSRMDFGVDSYNTMTHTSTQKDLFNYSQNPKKIESSAFKTSGGKELIKIENRDLIEEIKNSVFKYYGFSPISEYKRIDLNNRFIDDSFPIRWCVTCLYNDLQKPRPQPSRAKYIIGEILAYYTLGLRKNEPILNEADYKKSKPYKANWKDYLKNKVSEFIIKIG
jgi:hypothetical protein